MRNKLDTLTSGYIEIIVPNLETVQVCPFTDRLLAELKSEFELRKESGKWCGFAALDNLPEELSGRVKTDLEELHHLCTVIFLKGEGTKNFLLQSIDREFLLLDDEFRLLHKCPSLSHLLDEADISPICH